MLRSRLPLHAALALVSPAMALTGSIGRRRGCRAAQRASAASAEERLELVEHALGTETFLLMPTIFAYAMPGFAMLNLARRLLGDLANPDELQTVIRGLPHNVTTEMDLALWQLTERIRADPDSAAAFRLRGRTRPGRTLTARFPRAAQRGMTGFLRRYGHRAVAEIDLGMPRWRTTRAT